MGSGFNVTVGEVRAHATTVSTVAAMVRSASGSAQDSVGGGAFGQIGQFFAQFITQAADQVRQDIARASQTVEQVQSGLGQVADAYQAIDERHMTLFNTAVPEPKANDR
jgi:flagellar hook-basal body complex protein FliE